MSFSAEPIELDVQTAFAKLTVRLAYIQDSIDSLNKCRSLHAQQQQASELREDFNAFDKETQDLVLFAEDYPDWKTHKTLLTQAHSFLEELPRLRKKYRDALLNSMKEIDALGPAKRETLSQTQWDHTEENYLKKEGLVIFEQPQNNDENVITTNQNLTDALRKTAQTLQEELEKSVLATQILESSTATVQSSTLQQEVLNTVMDTSRQLVKALERADWTDRMLILAALLFFILVVLFVLKQRIVDRGFRLVFWWTRFLSPSGQTGSATKVASKSTDETSMGNIIAHTVGDL